MKYNLKNFPKYLGATQEAIYQAWKKGFEKELRSLHDRVAKPCCKYVLEEILGDG